MRSIGPESLAFLAADAYNSFRLVPDQNSRSNSSLRVLTRRREMILRKIAVQLVMDTPISISTTTCTTQLALSNKWTMEKSCVMSGVPIQKREFSQA